MRRLLPLMLLLAGCRELAPSPDLGACADPPEGVYDYGEIGIGTCLAGPTGLKWYTDPSDPARQLLFVANANPWLDFTGGSVLALDLSDLPRDGGDVMVDQVAASALALDNFPGDFDIVPERGLLLVTNRLTDDSRTRVGFDELQFIDISNPDAIGFAGVGPGGSSALELMSDPDLVVYDPASGLAFVENFTSHTLSVVDALADPVDVIDAVGGDYISPGRFFDVDASGSEVEIATLEVYDSELVVDQEWSLVYAEGTHRLWVPEVGEVRRWSSQGDGDWRASGLGVDLDPDDTGGLVSGVLDPQPFDIESVSYMLYAGEDTGAVHLAAEGSFAGNWAYFDGETLSPRDGEWDAWLGGPAMVRSGNLSWLFYDGVDSSGEGGIGLAIAEGIDGFSRLGDGPIVSSGNGEHDLLRAADPYVVFDSQARVWRMFYGAYDGARWTIGHAESDDLSDWVASTEPVFAIDGVDVAAPVVVYASGEWRMWTARTDGDGWAMGLSTSPDGARWTDRGVELPIAGSEGLIEPPGAGLLSQISRSWGLYGDTVGPVGYEMSAGNLADLVSEGFRVQLSAGALLSPRDAPDEGANGVQVDSYVAELGLVYLTLTDTDGLKRVGVADWNDGAPVIRDEVVLEGEAGAFDAQGVSHATVFAVEGGYRMLYAGSDGEVTAIGAATSADGLSWTTDHAVSFAAGDDWDSLQVLPGSVVANEGGGYTLWYTGADTETRSRVGVATSPAGVNWTRQPGASDEWQFEPGSPGQFDDTAVRQPMVLVQDGVEHLWYAGNDGERWRIGYAWRAEGSEDWTRALDPSDGEPRPVITLYPGSFDAIAAQRPVVFVDEAGVFNMLYTGQDGLVPRSGLAQGLAPDRMYRVPASPSTGDRVEWTTWLGDGGQSSAISLKRRLEGFVTDGNRVSLMSVDAERGFLYVASRAANFIYVIDIRDDSTAEWSDANYLDLEGLLVANTDVGALGFRGVLAVEGTDLLYALNDNPESVMIIDLNDMPDDDRADIVPAAVMGYLPAARSGSGGGGRDLGVQNDRAIGPIRVVQSGDLLFVSNYSENSVGVYDLRLGAFGALIEEVEGVGENPHAMALSPDGGTLAVANYIGEQVQGQRVSSTLTLIDVDPDSPDFLRIVARIVNQ